MRANSYGTDPRDADYQACSRRCPASVSVALPGVSHRAAIRAKTASRVCGPPTPSAHIIEPRSR